MDQKSTLRNRVSYKFFSSIVISIHINSVRFVWGGFADNVNSRGEFFTFIWNDSQEKARLAQKKTGEK
jgi:hypothetical protein